MLTTIRFTPAAMLALGLMVLPACDSSSTGDDVTPTLNVAVFNDTVTTIGDAVVVDFDNARQNVAAGTERNINWDGGAVTALTNGGTALFPPTLFRDGAGNRQIIVGAVSGETVLVSENSFATRPGGAANPSAGGGFAPLTGNVNFAVQGSNSTTVSFTVLDTSKVGLVNGMGVVFTDVEIANKSGLDFFDARGKLLLSVNCPAGVSGAHQFVGAVFTDAIVAQVKIRMGDNASFGTSAENPFAGGADHVVVDDFRFFLSGTEMPTTTFCETITDTSTGAFAEFSSARDAIALGNERNINWDGGAVTVLTNGGTAAFPTTLFRDGAGNRQIIAGINNRENVQVSENSFATQPGGAANPSAGGGFGPFTGTVNFAVQGSNSATVSFTTSNSARAGLVNGMAVVFTDVEVANKSGLRFLDASGTEILNVRAKAGASGEHQLVGALFSSPRVATVIIDMGDNDSFGSSTEDPANGTDHVVVDDFRFFLAQIEVPTVDFVSQISDLNNDVLVRFDNRRLPLAQGNDRNINWDGGAVTALTNGGTAAFPPDLFLTGAGLRQLTIGDPGENVAVSENAFATMTNGQSNPSAGAGFANLSPTVNFTVFGGNKATVRFFLADQTTPALVHGFGAVFTDVEGASSSLAFFDSNDALLRTVNIPASSTNNGHQFVGTIFPGAVVSRVEITVGNNQSFGTLTETVRTGGLDFVVLDDFRFFMSTTPK